MNKNYLLMLVVILAITACSTPETAIEPPCIRSQVSSLDGQSFKVEAGANYSSFNYRYNKAQWACCNRWVPEGIIESKEATVMCYEVVPGPGNIDQFVVALKIGGEPEVIYADSTHVVNVLRDKKISNVLQDSLATFKSIIGKTVWATPTSFVYGDKVGDFSKSVFLNNLEELTVYDAVISSYILNKNTIQVFLKRKSGEIVYKTYRMNEGLLRFNRDWHDKNPRDVYRGWSKEIWDKIEKRSVSLGMNSDMVMLAIGSPEKINRTQTEHGDHSQWVYGFSVNNPRFYYFKGDVLEAIQD